VAIQPDDHKDLPFEGGSEPVPHVKEPVPGPGWNAMHWVVIGVCVVIAALSLVWVVGW
jgi:hypothetical protein